AQILEELSLDRPGLTRARVAAQDMVDQGEPAPTGPSRELLARHPKQFRLRLGCLDSAERLFHADTATRTGLASHDSLMATLETHSGGRRQPRAKGRDNQTPPLALRALPIDGEGALLLRLKGDDRVTLTVELTLRAAGGLVRHRRLSSRTRSSP